MLLRIIRRFGGRTPMHRSTVGKSVSENSFIRGFLVGSHTPVLAWAVVNSTGPILELGGGLFSTPLIRALSGKRNILTLESDADWFKKFESFASPRHEIKLIDCVWDEHPALQSRWSLVFVDQHPPEARAACINKLRENAEIIVVHDTEEGVRWSYPGMDETFKTFPFVVHCNWFPKWTTVLSMTRPLDDLRDVLFGG